MTYMKINIFYVVNEVFELGGFMALQPTKDQCERMRGGHLFKDTYREPVQPELVPRHFYHEPESPERYKYWQHKYCQRCGFEAVKKETE